jgi:ABC-2 type transport system permease protein
MTNRPIRRRQTSTTGTRTAAKAEAGHNRSLAGVGGRFRTAWRSERPHAAAAMATAIRVVNQLRRDHRTLALILLMPPGILALFRYVYDAHPAIFARIGTPLLGIFPLVIMFVVTSIAMLRERRTGTLERLMTLPIAKIDILAGYALAFGAVAVVQTVVAVAIGVGLLDVHTHGHTTALAALAILAALFGMAFGLFVSAFARTEFQAVQFMPALLFPQLILGGLFAPRDEFPRVLEIVSDILPLSYVYDAVVRALAGDSSGLFWRDVGIIAGATVVALLLGAATLRRRTR